MNFKDLTGWIGEWEVVVRDNEGNIIDCTKVEPNTIMDVGLDMMRDILSGAITNGEIKYIALGNSTANVTATQTTLGAEQFRKLVTSQTNQTGNGILLTTNVIEDTEATGFKTEEIGWFATTAATTASDTGVMIARVLYSRQKTNLESWTINRTDTFARG